jgi:hypothetical protein
MRAIVCWPAWIPLLQARAEGERFDLVLGKVERPRIPLLPRDGLASKPSEPVKVYLIAHGRLRAHVPLSAIRNTVQGFVLELHDLAALEPVTVRGLVLPWWLGAKVVEDVFARGQDEGAWKDSEEIPFPGWATEGLPAPLQAEAAQFAARVRRPAPIAPATPAAQSGARGRPAPAASSSSAQPTLF